MDTKEAGRIGGKNTWAKLTPQERSRVMSKRNLKRWKKYRKALRDEDARAKAAKRQPHDDEPLNPWDDV